MTSEMTWIIMIPVKMILLLVTLTVVSTNGAVTFKDGAYSGVMIQVDENLPIENCREILMNLEVILMFNYIESVYQM